MVADPQEKAPKGKVLRILTPTQMLLGFPIALTQINVWNRCVKLTKKNSSNNVFFVLSKRKY